MKFEIKEFHRNISDEEIINDVIFVAQQLNCSSITTTKYKQFGKYDIGTIINRFGSWQNIIKKSGLKSYDPHNKKICDEDLMNNLKNIWIILGKQPSFSDVKTPISKYSIKPYLTRFGTWRKALEYFIDYINREDTIEKNSSCISSSRCASGISNVDRQHKTKRDINLRLRFFIMKRDNFKCCFCGASPAKDSSVELHIDHIVPWSKGGETTIDNLQTLCSKCNLGKSDLTQGTKGDEIKTQVDGSTVLTVE